jgi:predicted RNA binding protein YcfA (HicA-like mRNA interferase family)
MSAAGGTLSRVRDPREGDAVTFSELVRLPRDHGVRPVREKGSVRYDGKDGWPHLVRVDYHGAREVPTGTLHAIPKAAGIDRP